MKILHIISSSGMYGAEAVILNLSRILNERGDRSILAAFSNSSNPNLQLHERATAEGIESHVIPCSGQMDRSAVAAIRELARRTGADVVHSHNFKSDVYTWFALRGASVPIVATCHTWYDTDLIVTLYGKIDRFVLRSFARVVAVSGEVKQRLLKAGVRADKIRSVRNGIDLRPFEGVRPSLREATPDAAPIVGLIGRLAWEKGVDIFLGAAARVLAAYPDARFVVVGEGPDRDKLDRSLDELNIRDRVTLLGRRDDMPAVYASLDIMVSASRQEGLPMAILEGMASGLPLVATTVGEVPSVVQNGRTGILVPPQSTGDLADAVLALLRDPARRAAMGAAAKELIRDEYSAERMAADYLRVYNEAIATVAERAPREAAV
jgi:glycosyltransferase involved in cell wall biosynthesis